MKPLKHSELGKVDPHDKRAAEAAAVRRDNATAKRGETEQARGESLPPTEASDCGFDPILLGT